MYQNKLLLNPSDVSIHAVIRACCCTGWLLIIWSHHHLEPQIVKHNFNSMALGGEASARCPAVAKICQFQFLDVQKKAIISSVAHCRLATPPNQICLDHLFRNIDKHCNAHQQNIFRRLGCESSV